MAEEVNFCGRMMCGCGGEGREGRVYIRGAWGIHGKLRKRGAFAKATGASGDVLLAEVGGVEVEGRG